jgi:hypothetical protein
MSFDGKAPGLRREGAWAAAGANDPARIASKQPERQAPLVQLGDALAQLPALAGTRGRYRYHASLDNLTPADVYFRRGQAILVAKSRRDAHRGITLQVDQSHAKHI